MYVITHLIASFTPISQTNPSETVYICNYTPNANHLATRPNPSLIYLRSIARLNPNRCVAVVSFHFLSEHVDLKKFHPFPIQFHVLITICIWFCVCVYALLNVDGSERSGRIGNGVVKYLWRFYYLKRRGAALRWRRRFALTAVWRWWEWETTACVQDCFSGLLKKTFWKGGEILMFESRNFKYINWAKDGFALWMRRDGRDPQIKETNP